MKKQLKRNEKEMSCDMQRPTYVQPSALSVQHEMQQIVETTCCIVGAGPAGALLALLLARQGIEVTLLEAHTDFERDFRGDTLSPSVLTIIDELGLADRLLRLRHTKMPVINVETSTGVVSLGDFRRLKTKYSYLALLSQRDFLAFLTEEAARYPSFHLVMGAQVNALMEEGGRISGVRYRGIDGSYEVRAVLTVGTDGRFSRVRKLAGFEPIKTSPLMDVLWFRLSHKPEDTEQPFAHLVRGHILLTLNRSDYWQVGLVIPKGTYQQMRAAGLEQFRHIIAKVAPPFADRVEELREWKQLAVFSVEASRLPRWYRPGLLLIGDAAHVMSPVGGVGINYAIQDAVIAANVLAEKLKYGVVQVRDLAKVQRQREMPTRVIQAFQNLYQDQMLAPVLLSLKKPASSPMLLFLLSIPLVNTLLTRLIAFGVNQVHVEPQLRQIRTPA
jgi:2-polyprenyl-6-methoxyphenol hydroxylase-like FAD-dependent oxidoreductase